MANGVIIPNINYDRGIYTPTESVPANNIKTYTIYFNRAFSTPPSVVANIKGTYNPITELTGVNIENIWTDRFSVRVRNSYSSPLTPEITWIAMQ